MRKVIAMIIGALALMGAKAQVNSDIFEFQFEGFTLNGVLSVPTDSAPKGIVMIVHGSGRTDAVARDMYADVRAAIARAGYGTYMWDKMGCGQSEGTFDYNQTVQSSASEVIAAIRALQDKQISGADRIGLWGISRAGWINPIVINRYRNIAFWISVSGVDERENFSYLLAQNLRINGHPEDSVRLIVQELIAGYRLCHAGEDFDTYMAATQNLRENGFWKRFNNDPAYTKEGYEAFQTSFMKEAFDEKSGLQVYIERFDSLLSQVECPVLALFGENDMNVDWQQTKALYQRTLGVHTELTIRSFAGCNHNLFQCRTGSFYEFQDDGLPWVRCEGFWEEMEGWLTDKR